MELLHVNGVVSAYFNFDDYANVDKDVAISETFSDEKIIAKIQQKIQKNNNESEDCDESENEEIKEVRPFTSRCSCEI